MPVRKKLLRFLLRFTIVSLVTLFLTEAGLRIYHRIRPLPIFYSNSYNRFRAKPFSRDYDFRLNSRGFKDVEFETVKAEGTYRILGLGDSFTFGVVPYRDNYLTLAEEGLRASGRQVELINMGIPSTGPGDYAALLMHEGLELNPDMVLVSFFIGNDFLEARQRGIYTYSYVATTVKYLIDVQTKFEGRVVHDRAAYSDDEVRFTDEAYVELEKSKSGIYLKRNEPLAGEFRDALSHLELMKAVCERRGIRFTVILIPDEVQVSQSLQQKVVLTFGLSEKEFDFTLPNRWLAARLRERNIDYLDLLEDFRAASTIKRLYIPNDTHWNIRGNHLAAEIIQRYMLAQ